MEKNKKYNFHFDNLFGMNPIHTHYFDLHQVGDLFLPADSAVPEHKQYCFEITFVAQGFGTVYVNGIPHAVKKSDLQFSFPGEAHILKSDERTPMRFFYLALTPAPNTVCETVVTSIREYSGKNGCIFSFPDVFESAKKLLFEFYNKGAFFDKKVEALIIDILISIFREITGGKTEKRAENPTSKEVIIYNVVNYINSADKMITLKDISRKFFYDYNYISKNFKKLMNVGLRDYLYNNRLEKSVRLLASEDKSITEISELLGYSSIHSFSRSFKQKYGVSPENYRKQSIEKKE